MSADHREARISELEQRLERQAAELNRTREELRAEREKRFQQQDQLGVLKTRYATLFDNALNPVFVVDDRGRYVEANQAALEFIGCTLEELTAKTVWDFIPPGIEDQVKRQHEPFAASRTLETEYWVGGRIKTLLLNVVPVEFDDRTVLYGIGQEITEQKKGQQALAASEARYRFLVENAPIGIISVRQDGTITDVNRVLLDILGSPSEGATKSINMFQYGPLVDAGVSRAFRTCMDGDRAVRTELPYTSKWGKQAYLRLLLTPQRDTDGRVCSCLGVVEDVTDRKLAEDEGKRQQLFARALLNATTDSAVVVNRSGRVVDLNEAFAGRFDSTPAAMMGSQFRAILPPELADQRAGQVERVFSSGSPIRFEEEFGGSWNDGIIYPILDSAGHVTHVAIFAHDITDQKRAEQAVRQSEARFRKIYEDAPVMMHSIGPDRVIRNVNKKWLSTMGFLREEVLGKTIDSFVAESALPALADNLAVFWRVGEVHDLAYQYVKKDGSVIDVLLDSVVWEDDRWGLVSLSVVRDVSRQQSLQKQLMQAQKMEAVGTLAGGIAHDFNNILQIILGYTDMMLFEREPGNEDHEKLSEIRQAARDGADLVKGLLTFSRKVESRRRPLNLNQELKRIHKMLSRMIPKMVDIDLVLSETLRTTEADAGQFEQVIINLAVNAHQAMPNGGRLTIATKNVILEEEYAKLHIGARPGDYVLTIVADTGHGMPKDVAERIFEPFYTTKKPGEGTGLGLAMVYGIVKNHDGHITCYSVPGTGTTFKVYLPAVIKRPEVEIDCEAVLPPVGDEVVLLVDDEERLRDLGTDMLSRGGYQVLTAATGEEALAVYERHAGRIALVILDLVMPGMGGLECLHRLSEAYPNAKVLIASGYYVNGPLKTELDTLCQGIIEKPFDALTLLRVIREILDVHDSG